MNFHMLFSRYWGSGTFNVDVVYKNWLKKGCRRKVRDFLWKWGVVSKSEDSEENIIHLIIWTGLSTKFLQLHFKNVSYYLTGKNLEVMSFLPFLLYLFNNAGFGTVAIVSVVFPKFTRGEQNNIRGKRQKGGRMGESDFSAHHGRV